MTCESRLSVLTRSIGVVQRNQSDARRVFARLLTFPNVLITAHPAFFMRER